MELTENKKTKEEQLELLQEAIELHKKLNQMMMDKIAIIGKKYGDFQQD